jgi:hypothetical protein
VKRLIVKRDVALMMCDDEFASIRAFTREVQGWGGVDVEPFFDRGSGPTGFRILRDGHRFANVFPSKSLQFAHCGVPLTGLGLPSEDRISREYQSMSATELGLRLSEARVLASYAYWRAGL